MFKIGLLVKPCYCEIRLRWTATANTVGFTANGCTIPSEVFHLDPLRRHNDASTRSTTTPHPACPAPRPRPRPAPPHAAATV